MHHVRLAIYAIAAILIFSPASADDAASAAARPKAAEAASAQELPADATSQHVFGKGDSALRYTATAGTLPMTNDKGETIARIFYVAYTTGDADRPVSFVFNGGPGAA